MLAATAALLCAFSPPSSVTSSASPSSVMSSAGRREFIGSALLVSAVGASVSLASVPLPALAVAPPSPQQILKSRSVYGSRIYRLQSAAPAVIMDEKNVFTIFISGVYGATADKATRKELEKLEKKALAAAGKGSSVEAQAAVKEFVALAKIEELDMKPGSYFNAKSPCDRAGLQCGYQYEGYLGSRNDDDMEKAARIAQSLKSQQPK